MSRITHPSFTLLHKGNELSDFQLESLFPEVHEFLADWNKKSAVLELQTSGSTGTPKRFKVAKDVMWHSAGATIAALQLKEGLSALNSLSCQYVAGKMMLVRAMRGGWRLELRHPSTEVLDEIDDENEKFNFTALVPLQVRGKAQKLNAIDCTILGGAPVDSMFEEELKMVGTRVYETFGMTETVSHIALRQLTPHSDSFFQALPTVSFSQKDDSTLTIHAQDWGYESLHTTDIVELESEVRFKWRGRADFVINSGGVKLHPELIEPKLSTVLNAEVYVKGERHPELGTQLVGVVIQGTSIPEKQKLLEAGLSAYEIPKVWKEMQEFPMTASGKINRKEL
ncbi:MAG: AMP-binding protein [Flavobacteriia bacterium]|nr:AMP-binding protein [Flavobacteriia bacterium]